MVSWSSKKQHIVSRLSTKLEYWALVIATAEVLWIQGLLKELKIAVVATPIIWSDQHGAIALATNQVYMLKQSK